MEQPQQQTEIVKYTLEELYEDLDDFTDSEGEVSAQVTHAIQEDINTLNTQLGEQQKSATGKLINDILTNIEALESELVEVDSQIELGIDVDNAKFIRGMLDNNIAELYNQIKSLTEF